MKLTDVLKTAFVAFTLTAVSHAATITFTSASPNPSGSAITNGYGSDANVSVGYSRYVYGWPSNYGTLGGGTGAAAYDDDSSNGYTLTMTFTAAPGYNVTLDSFNLAGYDGYNSILQYGGAYQNYYSTDISVTGGTTSYVNNGSYPNGDTYTTYSPNVTGTSLTLTVTNLYDLGINDIVYHETAVSTTPEPSSLIYGVTGLSGVLATGLRRRRGV